jgi:hypothetical protein
MLLFLTGCVVGAGAALCVVGPFLLPWPLRVRYLANAQMIDPLVGLGPPDLAIREMRVVAVNADRGHVEVVIDDCPTAHASHRGTLARDACPATVVAQLDG